MNIDIRKIPVLCQCTVDALSKSRFRVKVWGQPPHDVTKFYTIDAKSDHDAAKACLAQFEKDVSAPKTVLHLI